MFDKLKTRVNEFIADERDTLILAAGFVGGVLLTSGTFYVALTHGANAGLILTKAQSIALFAEDKFLFYEFPSGAEAIITTRGAIDELRLLALKEGMESVAK